MCSSAFVLSDIKLIVKGRFGNLSDPTLRSQHGSSISLKTLKCLGSRGLAYSHFKEDMDK